MKTYLDELKQYFENTPIDQVLQEFAKYDTEKNNVGPTVGEFLVSCQHNYPIQHCSPENLLFQLTDKNLSPKFSSDFFLHNANKVFLNNAINLFLKKI